MMGQETLHPLVSVVDFSKCKPMLHSLQRFGFYAVFLKDVKCGDIRYGRNILSSFKISFIIVCLSKFHKKKNTLSKIFSHTKRSHSLFYENKVNTFPNRSHTSTSESVKMAYLSVIYIQSPYDSPSNFVSRI
jgi:hypothetical protein